MKVTTLTDIINKREEILAIAAKHGAYQVKIFGSFIRGEETGESDLDLLVQFEQGRSLFDLIGLKQELEDLLGLDVDVVTDNALHSYVKENVMSEAISL